MNGLAIKPLVGKESIPDWVYKVVGDARTPVGQLALPSDECIFDENGRFHNYTIKYRRNPEPFPEGKGIGFMANRSCDMGWIVQNPNDGPPLWEKYEKSVSGCTVTIMGKIPWWFVLIDYDDGHRYVTVSTYGEPEDKRSVKAIRLF